MTALDPSSERDTPCRTGICSYDADQSHIMCEIVSHRHHTVSMARLALSVINVPSSNAYTRNVQQIAL
jgi:hypothetical protein